jgi:uncharacterized protein (DUF2147 family)
MIRTVLLTLLVFASAASAAQSVVGKWKTIDDQTGEARSVVELTMRNGVLNGTIVDMYLREGETMDATCDLCEDDREGKPILGMEIIRDMQPEGDEWEDGTILDPETGKVYDCKIWLDEENPDQLRVRGYLYLFYRTQTWVRMED